MLTSGIDAFFALTWGCHGGHDATMDARQTLAAIVNADDRRTDLAAAVETVAAGGGPVGLTSDGELRGVVVPYAWWVRWQSGA